MSKIKGKYNTPTRSTHGSMTLTISIIFRCGKAEVRQMAEIIYEFQWQRFVKWLKHTLPLYTAEQFILYLYILWKS